MCTAGCEALGLWNVQVRLFGEDPIWKPLRLLSTVPIVRATVEEWPFRAALWNEARWASAPVVAFGSRTGAKARLKSHLTRR